MTLLRTILRELAGLFVDDGSLALGAVLWLALCAVLFRASPWGGMALFAGLALLLIENVRRAARRRRGGG